MSIDEATPEEWDRVNFKNYRKSKEPTVGAYMESLKAKYDYDGTEDYDEEEATDYVNSPAHYNYGKVECIEAIEESMTPEAFKGYLKGNTMKYLWRYERKGKPLEDLKKARWYLDRLIQKKEEEWPR
jgi:hypothetical protein